MQLDPERYEAFWRRGWTVVKRVFCGEQVDRIAARVDLICDEMIDEVADSRFLADRSDDGQVAPRKIGTPFFKHPDLRTFALSPTLRSLIEQLIGKVPLMNFDQVFMKPPHFRSVKPCHQDNAYFLCHPADEVITAWIALDDVDESNGCLRYIDGSHRGPILEHEPAPDDPHNLVPAAEKMDMAQEAPACVGKGGVVFHHSKTLHTSRRNESDRWRRAYATHWCSGDVTSESDIIRNAYFNAHSDLYDEALHAAQED